MGKIFGILMIVLGVWIGMEIFTKGSEEAFGGLFASGNDAATEAPAGARRSPVQAIGDRVKQSIEAGTARSTAGFGDESPDEVAPEE